MKPDNNIALNIIFVHGVYSNASAFDDLKKKLEQDTFLKYKRVQFSVIKYGWLWLTLERLPFVRHLVSEYVAYRIALLNTIYPNAKTIVFAHSFGTWATAQAMRIYENEMLNIDTLILFGSVIDRDFDWTKFLKTEIHNFVGTKDMVVFMSGIWGTGWSGKFGFKNPACNIKEYKMNWRHTDYPKGCNAYIQIIKNFYDRKIRE